MKTKNDFTIKEMIELFLQRKNYKEDLVPYQVKEAYIEVVGPFINKFTQQINFSDGILYLKLNSPALKNELLFQLELIKGEINKKMNGDLVRKIVLN